MRSFSVITAALLFLSLLMSSSCAASLFGKKKFRVDVKLIEDINDAKTDKKKHGYGPGDYGRKLRVDGRKRFYEIHVPSSYDGVKAFPVVLVFHGGGGDQGTIRFESQMDRTADRGGFIVVYPAGTNQRLLLRNRMLLWNDGRPYEDGSYSKVDDVKFVEAVLDDLHKLFKVDKKRVYACGYSNGAQFSFRLAKQLSNRIAAISTVAGQRPADDYFPPPPRAMPIMQFAGKKDTIGPYGGGSPHFKAKLKTNIKPVTQAIKSWVEFNECSPKPEVKRRGRAVMERYTNCRDGVEVILWTLEDGGHTWPGGKVVPAAKKFGLGNINKDISASDLMWDFFKRYSLN